VLKGHAGDLLVHLFSLIPLIDSS